MVKNDKFSSCCAATGKIGHCEVESVITVDERGQMVLPREVRNKANIKAGDKLTIISWKKGDKICCISLIRAEEFAEMVKDLLGPMMKEMMERRGKK
jgi:AbrB family looped-hinge helix DNA binding protein